MARRVTHGGVELNCELNVSHGFLFVESGYKVNDGPGYPRVKGMCNNVDGSGQRVLSYKPGPLAVNGVPLGLPGCRVTLF